MKPRVLVFTGYGLNCEEETAFAFGLAGASADIMHINDLIAAPKKIFRYQILVIPGGFSYGDDTGAGRAYAGKLHNHLWEEFIGFIACDRLVLGICNGFQIIASLGLVPAINGDYGHPRVVLLPNDSARYTACWTDLVTERTSPWLSGIDMISLPIAHGEGKFYADVQTMTAMKKKGHIALRYVRGEMCKHFGLPHNPTGTTDDIAGLTDESGRILGLMPHPERAVFFTQLPHWSYLKETYQREGKRIPKYGPGLRIFQNAVKYFH